MSNINIFDWVEFYDEFAHKLLDYKDKREELIEIVKRVFEKTGLNFPKLEKDGNIIDIDPFTVFAFFNRGLRDENRIKLIDAFKEELNIQAPTPTDFTGIPLIDPRNSSFFPKSSERSEGTIDTLWSLYQIALNYSTDQSDHNKQQFVNYFDKALDIKYVAYPKLTMALFWAIPEVYLNLDGRNLWYIYDSGQLPTDFIEQLPNTSKGIDGHIYLNILEKVQNYLSQDSSPLHSMKDLSYEAWKYSEEINQKKKNTPSSGTADPKVRSTHYWTFSPGKGASLWDEFYNEGIMAIGWNDIDDLTQYQSKNEMIAAMKEKFGPDNSYKNDAHATWQFVNEMQPGDIIFAKKGQNEVVGRGVVTSEYKFDSNRNGYKNVREVNWTHNGNWTTLDKLSLKTLTDITQYLDYVKNLEALFEDEDNIEVPEIEKVYPPYSSEDFLQEVYMDEERYETLVDLLKYKKNIILEGPPGVGKTFLAKRLAYSIMNEKNPERVKMIQFHQSYSYEDFIMGFRPTETGFTLKNGVFYEFCKLAENDRENDYFFIIDEINRGNLNKILGELFMLIEADKRDIELQLPYSEENFSIPPNIHIIGTMNTADRSIALLDYALRRRFSYFPVQPGFESQGFMDTQSVIGSQSFDNLIKVIQELNQEILQDPSLGDGFCIGHSYFCSIDPNEDIEKKLDRIIKYELIPLLKEYWFDEPTKVENWSRRLRNAIR